MMLRIFNSVIFLGYLKQEEEPTDMNPETKVALSRKPKAILTHLQAMVFLHSQIGNLAALPKRK